MALYRSQCLRIRNITDGNGLIQRLEDTLEIGNGVDEVIVQVRKIQNRLPEAGSVAAHRQNDAEGHVLWTQC
ncbi:hypothetical protein D3C71_2017340 [compost metagenome]